MFPATGTQRLRDACERSLTVCNRSFAMLTRSRTSHSSGAKPDSVSGIGAAECAGSSTRVERARQVCMPRALGARVPSRSASTGGSARRSATVVAHTEPGHLRDAAESPGAAPPCCHSRTVVPTHEVQQHVETRRRAGRRQDLTFIACTARSVRPSPPDSVRPISAYRQCVVTARPSGCRRRRARIRPNRSCRTERRAIVGVADLPQQADRRNLIDVAPTRYHDRVGAVEHFKELGTRT